jgi:hypothetical protein
MCDIVTHLQVLRLQLMVSFTTTLPLPPQRLVNTRWTINGGEGIEERGTSMVKKCPNEVGDDKNVPKRRVPRRLGIRYVFFFFSKTLTNLFVLI